MKALLVDAKGTPSTERLRVATPRPATPEALLRALWALIEPLGGFERASVGFPGVVVEGVTKTAPNLHPDEDQRDFPLAKTIADRSRRPTRVLNDAGVQGYGVISGHGVEMVLTLGTGMGCALFVDGQYVPNLELAHHPLYKGDTYEDHVGEAALARIGKKKWNKHVARVVKTVLPIFNPQRLYLGGGNAKHITFELPRRPNVKLHAQRGGPRRRVRALAARRAGDHGCAAERRQPEEAMALTGAQLTFRAGLSRLIVGGAALVLLPTLFPRTRDDIWLLVGYLVVACLEQVLIARSFGGRWRALLAGLLDVFVLTYFVHLLGSTTTVFAAVYFFTGTLNALVVGLRVGVTLAALNAIAYDVVVWCEWAKRIPYAPDALDVGRNVPPTFQTALSATVLVTVLLITSTTLVGILVHAVRRHEQDLTTTNKRLEDLSQRDPLTGLFNRRHLFSKLEYELARARRGRAFSLVMLDLDGFKRVNDQQGHLRGDLLLKEIANSLSASTRAIDVAARYGGDEFMIVLPDADATQARVVAERVTTSVRDVGLKFDPERPVTASLGVAVAHADDSVASIIRRADESAYRAKQKGGNKVELSA